MDTYRIIERLDYIQHHEGRTSRAMAKAIGVSPSTYCRWMEHSAEPDVKSIRLIAALEKRRTDDLLGRRVKDDQVLPQVPEEVAGRVENRDGSSMPQLVPGLRDGEPDPRGGPGSGEDRCDDPGRPETAGDEGRRGDAEKALIESCRLQEILRKARKEAERTDLSAAQGPITYIDAQGTIPPEDKERINALIDKLRAESEARPSAVKDLQTAVQAYERDMKNLANRIMFGGPEPKDNVNHPGHCTRGRFGVIDILESIVGSMNLTPVEAALTAQVVKYIARWKNKNGTEDLKKARWYLERLIGKVES